MIDIHNIDGSVLLQADITSPAKREEEMSKSDYISLSWTMDEKVVLPVGAYINHDYKIDKVRTVTRQFLLLEAYEPIQTDEMTWKYTPQFQHPKMVLSKVPFYLRTKNSQNEEIKQYVWSFVGTMQVMAQRIADFLNKEIKFGNSGWVCQYDVTNKNTINVSFSDNDFISALSAIVNALDDNVNWHIDYDNEVVYLEKGAFEESDVVLKVGKNVGPPSISNSKENYYNAFAVFGGSRNITQVNNKGENISASDIRLQLAPNKGVVDIDGISYPYTIDEYSTVDLRKSTNEQQFTKVLDFSQIFPSLNTYVYNVRGREKYVLDENNDKIPLAKKADGTVLSYKTFTVWYMRLAYPVTEQITGKKLINTTIDDGITHYWYDFEITDSLLINGKSIGCSFEANFNTGALSTPLAGRGTNGDYVGFELTYHKDDFLLRTSDDVEENEFHILAGDYEIVYQQDNDIFIPTNASEKLIPRGESLPSLKCNITVLYNIAMAESIYIQDAQTRLLDEALKEIKRLRSDLNNYTIKSYPHVFADDNPCLQIGQGVTYDDGNGYILKTRVLKLSTNIDFDYLQEITLGNQSIKGTITQLKDDVQSIIAGGDSNDGGSYTASQVANLIARYGTRYFLSKKNADTAKGRIMFAQGLDSNGEVNINNDLHAIGDISTDANLRASKDATVGGDLNVKGNATLTDVVVDRVHDAKSTPAERVIVGAQGFDLYMGEDGKSHLYIDYLTARTKFFAASAEVRKVSYSGGTTLFSNAGSTIMKVVDVLNESKVVIAYKCYALADDGTTKTMNWWHPGMMALCQTFNVKAGDTANLANRYYWRLVVGVGQETLSDGKLYDYVILSNKKTFVGNEAVVPIGSTQVIGWNGHPLVFGNVAIEVGSKGGMESFATVVADYEGLTNDESGTAIASRVFYGYEPNADGGEPDAPLPYDVIVQAGDQVQWGKYGNLIKLTTSVEDGTSADNAPSIAMYHKMGAPYKVGSTINPYQWKTLTSLDSPELVLKNANNFKFFTDDDPNNVIDPITVSYEINASADFIIRKPTTQTATPTDMTFTVTKRMGNKTEDVTATVNLFADYTTTDGVTNTDVPIKRLSDLGVSFYTLASVSAEAKDKSGGDTLATLSIPVLSDGENGKNGTSVTIKGSLDSVDQLPTTGKENESYIIAGDLWAYTGTSKEDAENHNGFTNMGRIKGEDGKSATQYYIHTAWMKAADGTGLTVDNPNGAAYPYIGTLVDANEKASINWSDYKWTYVKGDDVTISSKSVTYAISADGINHPSVWSSNIIEATNEKPYLWTRTLVTYKDSLGEHPVTSYSVSHKGKDGQNGDPGTNGKDAVEFVIKDAPMVFDTATDGVVPTDTSKTAKIYVYRGGANVSTQPIAGIVDQQGCSGARVTKFSDHFEVTLEGRYIKKDGGVSVTSGYVAVQLTYDGKAYVQQVPFLVNVAKFTGMVSSNNAELSSKYTELTKKQAQTAKDVTNLQTTLNGVPIKNSNDLTKYTSEIKQTAREISVEVSSEAVRTGRNMLLGSDFHRQGYGYAPNGTAFTESSLKIRTYDGFAGCNSLFIEQTAIGNSYAGVRWSDVPVTGGKTYVISAWLKRMSDTFGERCSIIVHEYAGNGTTIAKNNSFTALDADADPKGTWRKKAVTVTLQATTTRVNVIFCLGSTGAFSLCQPMMEEGTENNGWTLATADYGYIMGNRIVGSLALTKNAAALAQDGSTASIVGLYGSVVTGADGVAMVERDAQATKTQLAIVVQGYLKANTDYVLSFDVRRIDGKDDGCTFVSFVRKVLYSELYSGKVSIYSKENGNATESGYLEIKPSGDWQRVWVHFRLAADWTDATGKNFNIGVFGGNGTGNSIRAQFRRPKLEACAAMTEYTDAQADYIEDENISKKLRRTGIDITNGRITLDAEKTMVTGDLTVQGIITDSTSYVDVDGTLWSPNDVGELVNTKKNLRTVDGGVFAPIDMTAIKSLQIQTADPSALGATGINPSPALVTLPMYDAVNLGCGVTIPAYRRSGTHVLIRNGFSLAYGMWAKSASWGDANNKYTALRQNIANAAVYICTDPRLLALDNYKYATPTITPDGQDDNGASATAEWFKGGCFLNGRRGRWIALLPGQEIELVSVITIWKTGTNTAVPYLAWYVVGGSNIDWLDKLISIRPADSAYNGYDGYFEQEITGGQNFGVGSLDKYRDAFFGPRQLSDGYVDGLAAQTVVVTLSANEAPYLSVQ